MGKSLRVTKTSTVSITELQVCQTNEIKLFFTIYPEVGD